MARNNNHKDNLGMRTTLGKETRFNGVMRFKDSLKIDGRFEGEIISSGFLYVEHGAEIKADIKVGSVVIGGVVHGNIEAVDKLEMLSTGKVYGNIKTKVLKIADGVVFEGKCEMIKNSDTIDIFSDTVTNLKRTAQGARS